MGKIQKILQYLINSICYLKYRDPIVVNAWVQVNYGEIVHRNWGDELNVYLLELLTGKKVLVANRSLWHILVPTKNFICIGSVLGWYENKQSEIWGAGALTKNIVLKNNSVKIHLVRGKYTRQLLIKQGIECPECYGDPALLLSKLYSPSISKRYRMGIIPHYVEEDQAYISDYVSSHDDVCLISMSKYDQWTDVIDKIASCDFILSGSLHGLIVSDSYGIPNIWVTFSEEQLQLRDFKYRDYFSSVRRDESTQPIRIRNEKDLNSLYNLRYQDINYGVQIDYETIIKSCPVISENAISDFYY